MEKDFGSYELRERLGKGAMGWVFAGIKKQLDMQVAIKIPFPQFSEEEEFRQRFQMEARSMARMNHENVVRVIDFGDHQGTPFIAMEFLEGHDLRARLDRDGFPPIEIAMLMILDLCRGLEHAHSKNIVHRDLKPSNVMFTKHGVCKLMDFGLARRRDETVHLTRTGVVMGTTPYMSPEQTRGQEVDYHSDIFSLGVICYELLGGERPFQGDSSTAIMNAILYQTPRPLEALDPLVPERVVRIISKMLEKERGDRPSSVTDVRHEIEEALIELKVSQSREVMARFSVDPDTVGRELRQSRLAQCLDRAHDSEVTDTRGIEAALAHYRRALYLDPKNREAGSAIKKLERALEQRYPPARTPAAPPAPPRETPVTPAPVDDIDQTRVLPPGPTDTGTFAPKPAVKSAPEKPDSKRRPSEGKAPAPPPPVKPKPPSKPPRPVPVGGRESARIVRLALIAGGALVVAIIAVVVIALRSRSVQQPPAPAPTPTVAQSTIRVDTEPSGAMVIVNGAPGVVTPLDLGAVSPGDYILTAVLAGYETRTDTIRVASGWDTTLTLAMVPVSGEAVATDVPVLVVRTRPEGALVTVGARPAKAAPARFTRIAAGRIPIRIRADGYAPLDTLVTLVVGRDTTLRFTMAADPNARAIGPEPTPAEPATGSVAGKAWFTFRAWPWADVYVDDKLVLEHADTARVEVTPGNHSVEFRNPAYDAIQHRGRFKEGTSERLYAAFYMQRGHLTVRTADGRPCTVFIDGQAMPSPAPALYEVRPGKHKVRAMRDGAAAAEGEREVRLAKGKQAELTFTFGTTASKR